MAANGTYPPRPVFLPGDECCYISVYNPLWVILCQGSEGAVILAHGTDIRRVCLCYRMKPRIGGFAAILCPLGLGGHFVTHPFRNSMGGTGCCGDAAALIGCWCC